MSEFKITLASARVNAGYNIKEVAEITGHHHSKVINYERGRIPIPENDLVEFANLYKIPMKHLLKRQPQKDFEN